MRVVAKVGTSSITDDHGAIERAAIAKVTREIAQVRELVGRMATLVHEARAAEPQREGLVVLRPEATGAIVERVDEHEFRLVGRDVERVVALNDVTTPEALAFIDYRLEQLGVHRMLNRAGARSARNGPT